MILQYVVGVKIIGRGIKTSLSSLAQHIQQQQQQQQPDNIGQ